MKIFQWHLPSDEVDITMDVGKMEALEAYILGIWGENVTLASLNDNQKKNVVWECHK